MVWRSTDISGLAQIYLLCLAFFLDFKPIRGFLLDTIDTWPKHWFVEFNLTVHSMDEDPEDSQPSKNKDFFSVLHFTKGENYGEFGDRFPAFFIRKSRLELRPVIEIENPAITSNRVNSDTSIQFGRKYSFKLFSREISTIHKMQIFVDGELTSEGEHLGQQEISNLKVYVSNPWYQAPDVTLSDLRYGPYQS